MTINELAKNLADYHNGHIRVLDLQYKCRMAGDFDPIEVLREMIKYESEA